eukprot:2546191-Amphidinium_carterae.1
MDFFLETLQEGGGEPKSTQVSVLSYNPNNTYDIAHFAECLVYHPRQVKRRVARDHLCLSPLQGELDFWCWLQQIREYGDRPAWL